VIQLVTGYLPSVILVLFLYAVPPVVMLFSTMEGCISRSERKKSACSKVLYFTIWNVFFVNVFAGSVISQLAVFSSLTELPAELAKAVPAQVTCPYLYLANDYRKLRIPCVGFTCLKFLTVANLSFFPFEQMNY